MRLADWISSRVNPVSALAIVPLVVMSWHVFEFYDSDPLPVRIGLALSFDLLLVVLFVLMTDEHIKRSAKARATAWLCVGVLITFQLYVNVWTYWQVVEPARAVVSGTIFPLLVGAISWLASLRQMEINRVAARKPRPEVSGRPQSKPVDFVGVLATRDMVHAHLASGGELDDFRRSRNWKSVKRWAGEL